MSTEPNKSCSTCRWWTLQSEGDIRGDCDWIFSHPTPAALHYHQSYMLGTEGVCCPCWEPKP